MTFEQVQQFGFKLKYPSIDNLDDAFLKNIKDGIDQWVLDKLDERYVQDMVHWLQHHVFKGKHSTTEVIAGIKSLLQKGAFTQSAELLKKIIDKCQSNAETKQKADEQPKTKDPEKKVDKAQPNPIVPSTSGSLYKQFLQIAEIATKFKSTSRVTRSQTNPTVEIVQVVELQPTKVPANGAAQAAAEQLPTDTETVPIEAQLQEPPPALSARLLTDRNEEAPSKRRRIDDSLVKIFAPTVDDANIQLELASRAVSGRREERTKKTVEPASIQTIQQEPPAK